MSQAALAAALRAEGGLIAGAVDPSLAAEAGHASDRELVVAAVREGQLLHLGRPEVVTGADPDLALLAGDRLYALGLERLAAAGDLEAVAVLAELISACARAQAEDRPEVAAEAWSAAERQLL
jgi:hypothetical protein